MEPLPEPAFTSLPLHVLWEAFRANRDAAAREALIEHYLPHARNVAARMYKLRIDASIGFDDYLQYARVGLMESIDRFDARRGIVFEAYSTHRIRGAVLNGLGQESEAAAQRDFWRTRMTDRMQSLTAAAGRDVQRATLEDMMQITLGVALGVMLDDEHDTADESPQANPYAATELEQFTRQVKSLVERLPEREREIVRGHYFEQLEFQAIAQRYAISKGRVSQLHARALQRLRALLDERPRLDKKL